MDSGISSKDLFPAFRLWADRDVPVHRLESPLDGSPLKVSIPELTPARIEEEITLLREARAAHLADRPVREIIEVIDTAARLILDRESGFRSAAERLISHVSGYSREMTGHILDGMAADWLAPKLIDLIDHEFDGMAALDGFIERGGGRTHAVGPELTFHIFSGNVPGVAVTSLIRAMLVKSASLGKTAAGEPILPVLFARAIETVDKGLARCIGVTYWPGGTEDLEAVALAEADAVIAYGSDRTISDLRRRTPPSTTFLGYGNRISFGAVGASALNERDIDRLATDAALAVATFDQHGCVSPHLIYAEEGCAITPVDFAAHLAEKLDALEVELPRGQLTEGERSAIHQVRGRAEFQQIAGDGTRVFASKDSTDWTVVYDPDPEFTASCLNRVVRVKPVRSLDDIPKLVRPLAPVLQSVALAADPASTERLALQLGRIGVSRVTSFRKLPWPPATWHHDGKPVLAELVRWVDVG